MAESEIDRKIAVIFVADVVGYSKHMEKDENATFKAYSESEKIHNKLLKKKRALFLILVEILYWQSFQVL